ncbi:MAG TPA: MFS transporter [Candidatus Luteococcus avicola]|nr:MFS transporter [Candidatus Luteococcus avicola]
MPARRGLGGLAQVCSTPALRLAVTTMACAQFVMAAVMVLTPVHMTIVHHPLSTVGLTMSLHIFGMYAFSPLVGWWVDRAGERRVIGAGTAILALSLLVAWFAGAVLWRLDLALFLLGVGWSVCAVAGAVLLTRTAPDRPRVQGTADAVTSWTAALAAGLAGPVTGVVGYAGLAGFSALGLLPVVALLTRR